MGKGNAINAQEGMLCIQTNTLVTSHTKEVKEVKGVNNLLILNNRNLISHHLKRVE
jgi:hypothetical protein